LVLRKLSAQAGDELADVLMSRYEKAATVVTSTRPLEHWGRLLGETVFTPPLDTLPLDTPSLERLLHRDHVLKFEGKSCQVKGAAAQLSKQPKGA
jgi:DNA replication protein DnaC